MRIIALSDTHCYRPENVPDGDVLIHAGDICNSGKLAQVESEINWLASLPHKHKFLVPGNHDKAVELYRDYFDEMCCDSHVNLLIDQAFCIDAVMFYGYPWTPIFGHTAAFMVEKHKLQDHVKTIPKCDILITHGPPAGIFDRVDGESIGCVYLWDRVKRVQPRVHIFGHNHFEHGKTGDKLWLDTNQSTFFANAAYCRSRPKEPAGDPILVLDVTRSKDGTVNVENRST